MKFCSCALQTLSIYCLKNTSTHAAAHIMPGTLPTTAKTIVIGINE